MKSTKSLKQAEFYFIYFIIILIMMMLFYICVIFFLSMNEIIMFVATNLDCKLRTSFLHSIIYFIISVENISNFNSKEHDYENKNKKHKVFENQINLITT